MYRIIWNYGIEGWKFESKQFDTASEALKYAMVEPIVQFMVVKEITFVEAVDQVKEAPNAE